MSAPTTSNTAKQMFYKITQTRSTIGMPPRTRKNIEALGFKHRNQTIYQKVSPSTAHRLRFVKELVKIELTDASKSRQEINQERKSNPGFQILKGNLLNKVYE